MEKFIKTRYFRWINSDIYYKGTTQSGMLKRITDNNLYSKYLNGYIFRDCLTEITNEKELEILNLLYG